MITLEIGTDQGKDCFQGIEVQVIVDQDQDLVLCNVKWINVQIVIEWKKTVIRSIYFPASSHLVYCL